MEPFQFSPGHPNSLKSRYLTDRALLSKEFSKWTIAKLKSEIRNIRLDCLTLPGSDVHHSMQTPVGIQRRLVSCNQSTSECAVDCRRTRSIFSSREKALHRCVVPAVPSPAPGSPARSDLIFRISDLSFAIVHVENSFVGPPCISMSIVTRPTSNEVVSGAYFFV